jgi:hypothetical protein
MKLRMLMIAVAVVLAAPHPLSAQTPADSVHRRNHCRLAAQVIGTGQPAPKKEWALGVIRSCTEGGAVLAEAIRAARTSADTAMLNALTAPMVELRDGSVFSAAMDVAGDQSATSEARVFAIRILMWSMYPGGGIYYSSLAAGSQGCLGHGPSTHTRVTQGVPLPSDYIARAKALGHALAHDSTEAVPVRLAASCLLVVRPWPGLPS